MGYMEDYEDYFDVDKISYSFYEYEAAMNEKNAEISKLQSRIEELEEELENAKKVTFKNQRKTRTKATK